jgi:kumamolisin
MRATFAVLALAAGILMSSFLPTAAATGALAVNACAEKVMNGGFEAGTTGWEATTNGPYALVGPGKPHSGSLGAILGARNNADDRLEQMISLPAGQNATLRFWWYMLTDEPDHWWDKLEVTVKPAGSTESIRLARITDGDLQGQWQQATISLNAYAGQTIELSFRADTDSNEPTEFYLDDVSVQACDPAVVSKRLMLPFVMR